MRALDRFDINFRLAERADLGCGSRLFLIFLMKPVRNVVYALDNDKDDKRHNEKVYDCSYKITVADRRIAYLYRERRKINLAENDSEQRCYDIVDE